MDTAPLATMSDLSSSKPLEPVVSVIRDRGVSAPASRDFDRFYAEAHPKVSRALALTLADVELAAEAVDEAMARAFQCWDKVSTFDNADGWVYRVALNWSTSVVRRRRRHDSLYIEWGTTELGSGSDRPAPAHDVDPALSQAVGALPIALRSVVVCRFHLDLSNDDTAVCLGIRPGTVKSRLHRALTQLQRELGPSTDEDHHG